MGSFALIRRVGRELRSLAHLRQDLKGMEILGSFHIYNELVPDYYCIHQHQLNLYFFAHLRRLDITNLSTLWPLYMCTLFSMAFCFSVSLHVKRETIMLIQAWELSVIHDNELYVILQKCCCSSRWEPPAQAVHDMLSCLHNARGMDFLD